MSELIKWVFVFFCLLEYAYTRRTFKEPVDFHDRYPDIHFLNVGDSIVNNKPGLKIYCHNAESKHLKHIWKTMTMHLDINSEKYTLYHGKTPDEIRQRYDKNDKSFFFFDGILSGFKINPFKDICIGVYIDSSSESRYIMSITETNIDQWLLTWTIIGVLIFWYAQMLSQKSSFYYICGILFGVITSILILIYILWKLVQQVNFSYYIRSIFGALMGIFLADILFKNAHLILEQHREWIMLYILISSLISFMICYRFGPVTNPRTKQITQWFLQIVGLALVYTNSYLRDSSFFCCVILVLLYKFS